MATNATMSQRNLSEFYAAACAEHQMRTNPHLVRVLHRTPVTDDLTLDLTGNQQPRRVQRLSDQDVFVLCACLRRLHCETGLHMRFNNITGDGVAHLAGLLQAEGVAVRSLDLAFNNILADGAETLSRGLQCNCTLLSLRLSGNKIGNSGAMHLASVLQVNTALQELELAACDLGAQGVIALIAAVKSNRSLRSVDMSRPLLFSHQEEWAGHCSDMLAVNSSLVELHLGTMGMTDTGVERLSEGLRRNHSLRYLDLRCNRVTRDGVHHLAELLKQNSTLEIIDLSFNRMEDEGAVCLSEAVAQPRCGLKELSVVSNNIRREGLLSLAQAVNVNTTLTHIYIWGNDLEEPVCQAFRELMSRGRLAPGQTDVRAYEVDGQVFLAEVLQTLRKHYDS